MSLSTCWTLWMPVFSWLTSKPGKSILNWFIIAIIRKTLHPSLKLSTATTIKKGAHWQRTAATQLKWPCVCRGCWPTDCQATHTQGCSWLWVAETLTHQKSGCSLNKLDEGRLHQETPWRRIVGRICCVWQIGVSSSMLRQTADRSSPQSRFPKISA